MKLITARELPSEYLFRVHVDETKLDGQGNPDPAYVQEFRYGLEPPPGQTTDGYLAAILKEVKALCIQQIETSTEGIALAAEGATL